MIIIKIFKPSIKAFTVLEIIISLLIVSFCILTINPLLLDMLHYLTNLKNQTKNLCLTKNLESCYAVYKNHQSCKAQLSEP